MKKILSVALIVIITTVFGGLMSYVKAAYIEPAGSAPANNTPAPINADNSGYFLRLGKLGVTTNRSEYWLGKEIDATAFVDHVLVVMGQMSVNGSFSANGQMRIRGELSNTPSSPALVVANDIQGSGSYLGYPVNYPASKSLLQKNPNGTPLTFFTDDRTRAPRITVGSDSGATGNVNLFIEPGSKATNLGMSNSYCTLTKSALASTGCPISKGYAATTVATYLGQVFTTSNSGSNDIVAACYIITPSATPGNLGPC